jgi:hypothetical protein
MIVYNFTLTDRFNLDLNTRTEIIKPYIGNFTTFLKKKQQLSNKNFNRQIQIENKVGDMLIRHLNFFRDYAR